MPVTPYPAPGEEPEFCSMSGCFEPLDEDDTQGFCKRCAPSISWLSHLEPALVEAGRITGCSPVGATLKVVPTDVLRAGAQHMEDRAATYDKANKGGERSIEATVKAFAAITGIEMTAEQGWLFMALLKMVRCQSGQFKLDNYEDGAAYFALAAESAAEARQ